MRNTPNAGSHEGDAGLTLGSLPPARNSVDLPSISGERLVHVPGLSLDGDGLWKPGDECRLTGLQNPSMYLATAFSACRRDCHIVGQMSSDLIVFKKVSAIALS